MTERICNYRNCLKRHTGKGKFCSDTCRASEYYHAKKSDPVFVEITRQRAARHRRINAASYRESLIKYNEKPDVRQRRKNAKSIQYNDESSGVRELLASFSRDPEKERKRRLKLKYKSRGMSIRLSQVADGRLDSQVFADFAEYPKVLNACLKLPFAEQRNAAPGLLSKLYPHVKSPNND